MAFSRQKSSQLPDEGLTLCPLIGITHHPQSGHWQVTDLPARLRLMSGSGQFPNGWVLIQANLHAVGPDRSARLFADIGVPEEEMPAFDLPITAKGILSELIQLPRETRCLVLQPMNSLGEFRLSGSNIRPVNFLQRSLLMACRLLVTFYVHPRRRLHRLDLSVTTLFKDLPRAYQKAGSLFALTPTLSYAEWISRIDDLKVQDHRRITRDVAHQNNSTRFKVLVLTSHAAEESLFQTTAASLKNQFYSPTTVSRFVFDCQITNTCVATEPLQRYWLFLLPEGATLSPHALYWFAHEIATHPEAGWVYCDHDVLTQSGERTAPAFKPDWSPELLRSTNYIGVAAAVRADVWVDSGGITAANPGGEVGLHDAWLRISELLRPDQIRHICAPLLHVPAGSVQCFGADSPLAVTRHLARMGVQATVEADRRGHCCVRYTLPETQPLVSIIVPTRDSLDHLQPCIESIFEKTTYRNIELLVVDNQSVEAATLIYLAELATRPSIRVLSYPNAFNYSAINNFAAREAQGEFLCLLNNDTAVISPDWLEEMLGRLMQPKVGVVGAKLFYADGRVQHGGDTVGPGGTSNHLHHLLPGDAPGYMHRAVLAQDLSAVTGACLLTRRDLYLSLGGLNEQNLTVAFNDVDYCLRLREAGWRVVWTPYAQLFHYESISRGRDESPEKRARADREVAYMAKRWGYVMRHDPFYNPNLSYARPDFSLSHAPLLDRPWEKHLR